MLSFARIVFIITFILAQQAWASRSMLSLNAGGSIMATPGWASDGDTLPDNFQMSVRNVQTGGKSNSPYQFTGVITFRLVNAHYPADVASMTPGRCMVGDKSVPPDEVDLAFNGRHVDSMALLTFQGDSPHTISMRIKKNSRREDKKNSKVSCQDQGQLVVTY